MRVSLFLSVRLTGLEPARRETLDPKSSASTNSATGANRRSQSTKSIPFWGLLMSILRMQR